MRSIITLVVLLIAVVSLGCSTTTVIPLGTPFGTAPDDEFVSDPTTRSGPPQGTWTGTVTVKALLDTNRTETGDNDQDPNSAYYQTYTKDEVRQLDVTDTYTLTGQDPESLEYGVPYVSLTGPVTNVGSTTEREHYVWDKQNSACTWTQDDGTESSGSWTGSGDGDISLEFGENSTYRLFLNYSPANDLPVIEGRSWLENSNISANCEEVEPGYDMPFEGGPAVDWASDEYGSWDSNEESTLIDEEPFDAASGVVAGSRSWEMYAPEGLTLTVDWHFAHTGPITLPHD